MDLSITDSTGHQLLLTTRVDQYTFDAVTCTPHPDGFSVLDRLLRGTSVQKSQIRAACRQAITRNEVYVLPADVSPKWRIFLTPKLRTLDASTRQGASRLMKDLFYASQEQGIQATQLLITHFVNVREYPEPHIAGILDAIRELKEESFLNLKVLGFEFGTEHLQQFQNNVDEMFANPSDAPENE